LVAVGNIEAAWWAGSVAACASVLALAQHQLAGGCAGRLLRGHAEGDGCVLACSLCVQ